MRRTKIICTLGPSSNSEEMISKLIDCGMNVARLNFSHGTHETHQLIIDRVKAAREAKKTSIAILLDTKGPEIRIGRFENPDGIILEEGQTFSLLNTGLPGDETGVSVTYTNLWREVNKHQIILIDDGHIKLEVIATVDETITCKVLVGGKLTNNKGVNIPNVHINMPYLSSKDKADILFGIKNRVDFIAASFVRTVDDINVLRDFLFRHGGHKIRIIAKIENLEGIENFDEILEASDGIMVARGDMGVEIEYEKIPGYQKRFITKCREAGKMAVTATQMLESMTTNIMPTRAEITDVANAVFDGTSVVMLSGETANGKHPDLVVQTMVRIVCQAEEDSRQYEIKYKEIQSQTNAICDAACITARDLKAKAIVAMTKSGEAARLVSKYRPKELIIATTPSVETYYQLALSWGVYPILTQTQMSEEDLINESIKAIKEDGILSSGDTIVLTAGLPLDTSGTTNLLKVIKI